MAPTPASTPRKAPRQRDTITSPSRKPTISLTDAILGRNLPPRRASVDLTDRAVVTADLRRERTKLKENKVDIGESLGPYDSDSVRDRVRKWQAQGGGVVEHTEPAVSSRKRTPLASSAGTDNHCRSTPQSPGFQSRDDDVDTGETVDRSRKEKRGGFNNDKDRSESRGSSTAPRKRVVSDSRWVKKKKAAAADDTAHKARETSEPMVGMDGIRVTPIRPQQSPTKRRHELKPAQSIDNANDDGIRVYGTPTKRSNHLKPRRSDEDRRRSSGSHSGMRSEEDRPSSRTTPTPPRKEKADKDKDRTHERHRKVSDTPVRDGSGRQRKPSRRIHVTPKRSPRSSDASETVERRQPKSAPPKVSIIREVYDEGRKIFSKPEPTLFPPAHGSRIEAWLDDTPDPFIDGPVPVVDHAELAHAAPIEKFEEGPDNHYNKGSRSAPADASQGSGEEGRDGSKRHRRPRPSRGPDQDPTPDVAPSSSKAPRHQTDNGSDRPRDIVSEGPSLNSPTLRRTGAKRSATSPARTRRGSAPLRDASAEDIAGESIPHGSAVSSSEPVIEPMPPRQQPQIFKRPFPSTGRHQLSTIASVETFDTKMTASASEISQSTMTATERADGGIPVHKTSLKRRLTKHADLISVLSMPKTGAPSIRSARSIRTNRSRLATATIPDLMRELGTDEDKYMRELNTLVDGVIPVLLSCVLSKSDSAVAAGLFSPLADQNDDANVTRPIVDMGIALERLKSLHKRIPRDDPQQLLHWAHGAQKVYRDYLKSWRMGFQDVIVNLAPANEAQDDAESLHEGLPQNEQGDVINGDGERVDVAFLLKRPLVRLKYLAKTFKGINLIKPSSLAEVQATKYHALVTDARQRSNEERARLEDQGAANIDPTRAREPRTLAPLTDVTIDRSRHVRARDYFSLDLQHSSGQRMDCKVELLLRDEGSGQGSGGDLLICEVDTTSRWLLFPPVMSACYSARNGNQRGEIVVMIRGQHGSGQEWHELLCLHSDDEQTGFEWVQMLGLTPVPPSIVRQQSFVKRQPDALSLYAPASPASALKSRSPSPREVEVPIGELARGASKRYRSKRSVSPVSPPSRTGSVLDRDVSISPPSRHVSAQTTTPTRPSQTMRDLNDAMAQAGGSSSRLRRTKAQRHSRQMDDTPTTPKSPRSPADFGDSSQLSSSSARSANRTGDEKTSTRRDKAHKVDSSNIEPVLMDLPSRSKDTKPEARDRPSSHKVEVVSPLRAAEPEAHRRTSSVPSMNLPTINKLRKRGSTPPAVQVDEREGDSLRTPTTPATSRSAEDWKRTPNLLKKSSPLSKDEEKVQARPPASPPQSPSPVQLKGSKTPKLRSPKSGRKSTSRRRSSSPLKHQYEPSSASGSSTSEDSETEKEDNAASDTSSDEELEDGDAPTPLLPLGALQRLGKPSPKGSIYSMANDTLTPSQSASQAPYKTVPQQPTKAAKTIASIFSWSDRGSWDSMHPNECSIVITPGLIEAYEMSAAHSEPVQQGSDLESGGSRSSTPQASGERPLVGLELTPLVPLRRGTALDISIRSPPTPQSQIRTGNNIMFRSRNPEECEALYALINQSRINNPTYIALQNARGPYGDGFGPGMDRRASARRSGWRGWGSRKSSYRASTRGTPSFAASESSVGTMSSAFSALRRFGNGGRKFNIARSSISYGGESRPDSVSSDSSGSSLRKDGSATPPDPFKGSPIGLSNAKIRLYQRETASKWRDMGSARMSITRPPAGFQAHGFTGQEKRVLIVGKTAGEPLLDECLGEAAFERVARTGIALSIWEEVVGPNGEVGQVGAVGGVGARTRVYMIQLKSEAETAYTFSLVGKLRY